MPTPCPTPRNCGYSFTVRLHDIDAAGVMFFGHLFRHAHDAYEAFMETIGFPLDRIIRENAWSIPLVNAEADYQIPLRHGDSGEIRVCVAAVGRSSYTLRYLFIDKQGRIRAKARTVHVQLDQSLESSAPLAKPLEAALRGRLCDNAASD